MGKDKLSFKRRAYIDEQGRTPLDEIIDFFKTAPPNSKEAESLVALMTFFYKVEHSGELLGTAYSRKQWPSGLSVYVHGKGRHFLYYSYYRPLKEVCFLYIYQGANQQEGLDEAIKRLNKLYF